MRMRQKQLSVIPAKAGIQPSSQELPHRWSARCEVRKKMAAESPWEGQGPSGPGVGCGDKTDPPRRFATAVASRHPSREGIFLGARWIPVFPGMTGTSPILQWLSIVPIRVRELLVLHKGSPGASPSHSSVALFEFPELGMLDKIVVARKTGNDKALHPIPEPLFEPIGFYKRRKRRT